jgi:NADPH-dependent curcumin reductase CurA
MRIYMVKGSKIMPPIELNKPLNGGCIGQVIESRSDKYKVGEYVKANFGWREYWVGHDVDKNGKDIITKVDPKIVPLEYFSGILGITGITAYVGLIRIGELREGQDTVFVSSAAGGVGSVACQIAKIKGCHVVVTCGSDEKVRWLFDELKVDHAFNYRKLGEASNISSQLRRVCPNGIDLYFDNVGGKHLEAAIDNMNIFGRIALCGTTSHMITIAYCYRIGIVFVSTAGILTVTTPSTYAAAPTTFSPSCVEIGSMILLSIWRGLCL